VRNLKVIGAFLLFLAGTIGLETLVEFAVVRSGLYRPSAGWTPGDFAVVDGVSLVAALIALFIASKLERRHAGEYYLPRCRIFGDVWGGSGAGMNAR
jgi:hypothetical protein